MGRLDFFHTKYPCAGSRKLLVLLKQEGYEIGRKLVRRLMQEMGLYTIYPKENLSKRNFKEAIVPYLLRNRKVMFSNEVWSIDITFIKLVDTHMYPPSELSQRSTSCPFLPLTKSKLYLTRGAL